MSFAGKSDYLVALESSGSDIVQRYKDKIRVIGGIDPYTLQFEVLDTDVGVYPKVTPFHIVTYLVLTHSFYTNKQMQAYKSLNAYKYFEAGFVQICGADKINDMVVTLSKVKHSQRMTLPPLEAWIIFENDGGINCAHCTCMAGLSEVCSHVAACLYGLEYIHNSRSSVSCTDVSAKWMEPLISNVLIVSLGELCLRKFKTSSKPKTSAASISSIRGQEMNEMMERVRTHGGFSSVMRVIRPFSTEIVAQMSPASLPTLYNIYNVEYEDLSYEELCVISRRVDQVIDEQNCEEINKMSIGQASNREWFNQRAGRITASRFKSVCRTNIKKPSISLVKSICYPLKFTFKTQATKWGLEHEKHYLESYKLDKLQTHVNFKLELCGLYIDPNFPAFGASPDGMVQCDCCGRGCVEVKCPYLLKNTELSEYLSSKNSCSTTYAKEVFLKRDHAYYYQVQLQLKLSHAIYCDFVVWSPTGFFEERITFDQSFWDSEFPKAQDFHTKVILLELLGRYSTHGRHPNKIWCICNTGEEGRPMLECANDTCEVQWFHLECAGLASVPESIWLCKACQ